MLLLRCLSYLMQQLAVLIQQQILMQTLRLLVRNHFSQMLI
ncbi:hypothetical protein SAMN05421644_102114 [Allochromatium warmingii]|uniref:Uncharacterized protein n=1 Tax=Allochromatium warmingii TaxID=61595 RepID=A0A1H3BBY7_ALLWA|nr:hypothetical protein SAMN05421644_102114 [Allochromatium warmingii]